MDTEVPGSVPGIDRMHRGKIIHQKPNVKKIGRLVPSVIRVQNEYLQESFSPLTRLIFEPSQVIVVRAIAGSK